MINIEEVKRNFKNKDLFDLALTHRSWVNEHKGVRESNERLEFLGDAILEFVVSDKLYSEFPDKEEGFLTALRANLVNTISLGQVAVKLELGPMLFLSKGEEDGGGRGNPSLLADTVEALIGSIFIDRGIKEAEEFIKSILLSDIEEKSRLPLKDPKSSLQEYVQSKGLIAPKYKLLEESGPDHNKKFVIEVWVDGEKWGTGEGKSKSTAEQEAARQSLTQKVK